VRRGSGAGNGLEGLPEVAGEGIGGGDGLPSGLDLNGAVSAGCLDELPDRPAGLRLDPAADGEGGAHDREAGLDGVAPAKRRRAKRPKPSEQGVGSAQRVPTHCAEVCGSPQVGTMRELASGGAVWSVANTSVRG